MSKFKKIIVSLALLVCMFALFCFSGCAFGSAGKVQANDYVGSYKSIFVDSQKNGDEIVFHLEIKENKTFILQKNEEDYYSGAWKSYTQNGRAEILCYQLDGSVKKYFCVCMLDDGTLMATPSLTNGEYLGAVGGFGDGALTMITLVLFEKV